MHERYYKSDVRIQTLRQGPGGQLLEGFAEELYKSGYAEITARHHIRAAEHLIYWTDHEGIQIPSLTEDILVRYNHHLKRCRCPGYGRCRYPSYGRISRRNLVQGARLFLRYLRGVGVTASVTKSTSRDPVLLVAFIQWMRQQRGTADTTLHLYSRAIRDLLLRLGEDPGRYDAKSLRQFVLDKSQRSGLMSAKQCTTPLRMFLRFLIAEGKCVNDLDAAIPSVAHWHLSSLPRYLQPEEVERVIDSCDPNTPVGSRDRAIVLLLARLGLRARDIVLLRLSDIDWKEAHILVAGKGRRYSRLPLTQEVGNAIVNYLLHGRPSKSQTDALFIHSRAPFCAFKSHSPISVLVGRAMRRASVSGPSGGAAHVLRHSAATAMLRQGASLQDIAALLRHRSIETTQIYAKVNVAALRRIAQPWPEVQPC